MQILLYTLDINFIKLKGDGRRHSKAKINIFMQVDFLGIYIYLLQHFKES